MLCVCCAVLCDGVDMIHGSEVKEVSSIEVKQSRGAETRLDLSIFSVQSQSQSAFALRSRSVSHYSALS